MLRQLARLTRPYPAAGPSALAIATYGDPEDRPLAAAAESGLEGVACVDDAARGVVLFSDLWSRTGSAAAREWAHGLLEFCLWMTDADGLVTNFVRDWAGTRNEHGATSRRGGLFWQARALRAFERGAGVLGDDRARVALERVLAALPRDGVPPDVRSLHALTALELAARDERIRVLLSRWCDEISATRDGVVLLNSSDERGTPHLWGHLQEGVLASAAVVLGRSELLDAAVRSVDALIVPAIEESFSLPVVQPYAVASAVFVVDRLFGATGDARYRGLATDARAWFDGRNSARAPVYDRERGRVSDGIDGARLSKNSGAEANIVAATALLDEIACRLQAGDYNAVLRPDRW